MPIQLPPPGVTAEQIERCAGRMMAEYQERFPGMDTHDETAQIRMQCMMLFHQHLMQLAQNLRSSGESDGTMRPQDFYEEAECLRRNAGYSVLRTSLSALLSGNSETTTQESETGPANDHVLHEIFCTSAASERILRQDDSEPHLDAQSVRDLIMAITRRHVQACMSRPPDDEPVTRISHVRTENVTKVGDCSQAIATCIAYLEKRLQELKAGNTVAASSLEQELRPLLDPDIYPIIVDAAEDCRIVFARELSKPKEVSQVDATNIRDLCTWMWSIFKRELTIGSLQEEENDVELTTHMQILEKRLLDLADDLGKRVIKPQELLSEALSVRHRVRIYDIFRRAAAEIGVRIRSTNMGQLEAAQFRNARTLIRSDAMETRGAGRQWLNSAFKDNTEDIRHHLSSLESDESTRGFRVERADTLFALQQAVSKTFGPEYVRAVYLLYTLLQGDLVQTAAIVRAQCSARRKVTTNQETEKSNEKSPDHFFNHLYEFLSFYGDVSFNVEKHSTHDSRIQIEEEYQRVKQSRDRAALREILMSTDLTNPEVPVRGSTPINLYTILKDQFQERSTLLQPWLYGAVTDIKEGRCMLSMLHSHLPEEVRASETFIVHINMDNEMYRTEIHVGEDDESIEGSLNPPSCQFTDHGFFENGTIEFCYPSHYRYGTDVSISIGAHEPLTDISSGNIVDTPYNCHHFSDTIEFGIPREAITHAAIEINCYPEHAVLRECQHVEGMKRAYDDLLDQEQTKSVKRKVNALKQSMESSIQSLTRNDTYAHLCTEGRVDDSGVSALQEEAVELLKKSPSGNVKKMSDENLETYRVLQKRILDAHVRSLSDLQEYHRNRIGVDPTHTITIGKGSVVCPAELQMMLLDAGTAPRHIEEIDRTMSAVEEFNLSFQEDINGETGDKSTNAEQQSNQTERHHTKNMLWHSLRKALQRKDPRMDLPISGLDDRSLRYRMMDLCRLFADSEVVDGYTYYDVHAKKKFHLTGPLYPLIVRDGLPADQLEKLDRNFNTAGTGITNEYFRAVAREALAGCKTPKEQYDMACAFTRRVLQQTHDPHGRYHFVFSQSAGNAIRRFGQKQLGELTPKDNIVIFDNEFAAWTERFKGVTVSPGVVDTRMTDYMLCGPVEIPGSQKKRKRVRAIGYNDGPHRDKPRTLQNLKKRFAEEIDAHTKLVVISWDSRVGDTLDYDPQDNDLIGVPETEPDEDRTSQNILEGLIKHLEETYPHVIVCLDPCQSDGRGQPHDLERKKPPIVVSTGNKAHGIKLAYYGYRKDLMKAGKLSTEIRETDETIDPVDIYAFGLSQLAQREKHDLMTRRGNQGAAKHLPMYEKEQQHHARLTQKFMVRLKQYGGKFVTAAKEKDLIKDGVPEFMVVDRRKQTRRRQRTDEEVPMRLMTREELGKRFAMQLCSSHHGHEAKYKGIAAIHNCNITGRRLTIRLAEDGVATAECLQSAQGLRWSSHYCHELSSVDDFFAFVLEAHLREFEDELAKVRERREAIDAGKKKVKPLALRHVPNMYETPSPVT